MFFTPEQGALFEKLQKQFLSCYSLRRIPWQSLQDIINWEVEEAYELQAELIRSTYKSQLNVDKPINVTYQYEFLKNLIKILEAKTDEVHDIVYESLAEITQRLHSKDEYVYKHFLHLGNAISMKESPYFVSEGTTGLCTWPASIALAEYCLQHPQLIEGSRVLELGAGLGFCSLFLFKYCSPRSMLVTDGSLACLKLFANNLELNFPKAKRISAQRLETDDGRYLEYCQLKWQSIDEVTQVVEHVPNLVLGSDIIYESDSHHSLIETLNHINHLTNSSVEFIFSFAIRNPSTVNLFLKELEIANYKACDMPVPVSGEHLFWDDSTPIRIISIRSNKLN